METRKSFVGLVQAYPEVGVSFDGTVITASVWKHWFSLLNTYITPAGKMLGVHNDFRIVIYICASALISDMKIKGPTKSKTHRTVEYFIWVPYSPVVNSLTPLATLTKYFTQGVADVLRKLEYPDEAIQKVLTHLANKQIQDNE